MTLDEIAPFLSSRLLHLILLPTEQCNFRCVYCYEDFTAGEMSRQVIDSVKALMVRRIDGLDQLSITWYGGEPLLAWPIVEEIQTFAADLAREHPRLRVTGSLSTNGSLLSRQRFERLLGAGVRSYQISLDGTREAHDSTRRRRGGGGSFAVIWRNLLAMRASAEEFHVRLRLHVTQDNQEAIELLLAELARELRGDPRFTVILKAIRRFGGPRDADLPVLSPEDEPEVLGRLTSRAVELGFADRQDVFAEPGMLQGCYAAAAGSYVVRSSGDLAKCTVALDHPNNRVGRLLPDGRLAIDSPKMIGWLRGALNGDRESLHCPMKGWADDDEGRDRPEPLVRIGATS